MQCPSPVPPSRSARFARVSAMSLTGVQYTSPATSGGAYLGCVYTDDLISQYGRGGSLGILIFFLIAAALKTFIYSFPSLLEALKTKTKNKTSELKKQLKQLAAAVNRYDKKHLT
ncbi:hypothetical protein F5Y19DRAFT_435641 [Xylariaceae sp. FL1651]|nr:hypothetical protein F5Y19DRAFT_435641 [Xylariaceae sp. FL1651]